VRGLCHDITPVFLPACTTGTSLALRHAPLCVAKWSHRNVSEDTHACPAISQALSSAHTVSWPHPQATLHSVCAHGPGSRGPVTSRATPAGHPHAWASTQDEHLDPHLPPLHTVTIVAGWGSAISAPTVIRVAGPNGNCTAPPVADFSWIPMARRCMASTCRPGCWYGPWARCPKGSAIRAVAGCSRWTRTRCCSGWLKR